MRAKQSATPLFAHYSVRCITEQEQNFRKGKERISASGMSLILGLLEQSQQLVSAPARCTTAGLCPASAAEGGSQRADFHPNSPRGIQDPPCSLLLHWPRFSAGWLLKFLSLFSWCFALFLNTFSPCQAHGATPAVPLPDASEGAAMVGRLRRGAAPASPQRGRPSSPPC